MHAIRVVSSAYLRLLIFLQAILILGCASSIPAFRMMYSAYTSYVTGKFGLGVWNEAGKRLTEFCQENALVTATSSSNNTREDSTRGHHQMVNTEIRLIIFFAAKHGEAVYSQQKQDQEVTVAQIMNSLLTNSDLN